MPPVLWSGINLHQIRDVIAQLVDVCGIMDCKLGKQLDNLMLYADYRIEIEKIKLKNIVYAWLELL